MRPLKEMKRRLKVMNLREVARRSGVAYMTVYNFANDKDTKFSTVEKISDWLDAHDKGEA